jgi:hypothetical protein
MFGKQADQSSASTRRCATSYDRIDATAVSISCWVSSGNVTGSPEMCWPVKLGAHLERARGEVVLVQRERHNQT